MVDFASYRVALCHRELRVHGDVHLGAQAMAYPPRPHLGYVLHPFYAGGRVTHLIH